MVYVPDLPDVGINFLRSYDRELRAAAEFCVDFGECVVAVSANGLDSASATDGLRDDVLALPNLANGSTAVDARLFQGLRYNDSTHGITANMQQIPRYVRATPLRIDLQLIRHSPPIAVSWQQSDEEHTVPDEREHHAAERLARDHQACF